LYGTSNNNFLDGDLGDDRLLYDGPGNDTLGGGQGVTAIDVDWMQTG